MDASFCCGAVSAVDTANAVVVELDSCCALHFFVWAYNEPALLYLLVQSLHAYGRWPVCVYVCSFSEVSRRKDLVQMLQWYFASPVCMVMCRAKVLARANALLQYWQIYGFSPLWVLRCSCKYVLLVKARLHTLHTYGLIPVCVRICATSEPLCAKHLLHFSQRNRFCVSFTRLCLSTWFARDWACANAFGQRAHLCGLLCRSCNEKTNLLTVLLKMHIFAKMNRYYEII